jgi:uncharacterized protein (DUF1697 family)
LFGFFKVKIKNMATYISILRGINVSGQKLIKMDLLKNMYEKLGYSAPKTYVQSGNVVFESEEEGSKKISNTLVLQIKKDFGFDVPVIVLTIEELQRIIEQNPFAEDKKKDLTHLHVTFLIDKPQNMDITQLLAKKQEKEEIIIEEKVVYLYCPNGYGRTKLNNNFIESKLKVGATTRNWKTTQALLALAMK